MGVQGISKIMEEARDNMSNSAFEYVAGVLSKNKNNIREEIQKLTSADMINIIATLKDDKPIPSQDWERIKLWIVGDAESYVKMENNFRDWLIEFERVESILRTYENKELNANDLFKLHGILEDAIRVSYDIVHFLERKNRIKKFEAKMKDNAHLDKESRNIIIKILTRKLRSPDY